MTSYQNGRLKAENAIVQKLRNIGFVNAVPLHLRLADRYRRWYKESDIRLGLGGLNTESCIEKFSAEIGLTTEEKNILKKYLL